MLAEYIESGPPGVETLGGVGLSGQGVGNDHGLKAIKKSLHFGQLSVILYSAASF